MKSCEKLFRDFVCVFLCAALLFAVSDAGGQTPKDTISLNVVGDIMQGTNYPSEKYLPPNDSNILLHAAEDLGNADITFGNLEGSIYDGEGRVKKCADSTKCYAFRTPSRYLRYLKEAGFDVLNLANNHSGDFGEEARKYTLRKLDSFGILACGLLIHPVAVYKVKGVSVAFIGFSPNKGTLDINDIAEAKARVAALAAEYNLVIVSFHGGAEGLAYKRIPFAMENYYGEQRGNVVLFSRAVIDAGAAAVIGHGPHVPRAIENYKGKLIVYSLGNFATYGRFSLKKESGYAPLIKLYIDKASGKFLKAEIKSYIQQGEGIPVADDSARAYYTIKSLTQLDFPETGLKFDDKKLEVHPLNHRRK